MKQNCITSVFLSVDHPNVHVISREAPLGCRRCWYDKIISPQLILISNVNISTDGTALNAFHYLTLNMTFDTRINTLSA